jgi:hypothetical protein
VDGRGKIVKFATWQTRFVGEVLGFLPFLVSAVKCSVGEVLGFLPFLVSVVGEVLEFLPFLVSVVGEVLGFLPFLVSAVKCSALGITQGLVLCNASRTDLP